MKAIKTIPYFVTAISLITALFWLFMHFEIYKSFYGKRYLRILAKYHDVELLMPIQYYGKDLKPISRQLSTARNIIAKLLNEEQDQLKVIRLAVVDATCGPGCGELNGNRIEITSGRFELMYNNIVANNQLDHLLFYELGRNYWIFGDMMSCDDERLNQVIHTGFAVFIRDLVISKMEGTCATINGMSYEEYMIERDKEYQFYMGQNEIDFLQLVHKTSITKDEIELKATRIFASVLRQLYENYGQDEFIKRFSSNLKDCSRPRECDELFGNLLKATNNAADANLIDLFRDRWKMPMD